MATHRVLVNGAFAAKPARLVDPADSIELAGEPPRYVSRGGEKLAEALRAFGIRVAGRRALDAGASTGGFTDCLLQEGARSVIAVDVGHGQLHESLVADDRVVALERTNIRHLTADRVGGAVELVVADLSFISLRTVAAALTALTSPGADLVLLVKPQFEAGRREAARGRGVIRDPVIWRRVLEEVAAAMENAGAPLQGAIASPLQGAEGNVEFLVHCVAGAAPALVDLDAVVAGVR